MLNLTYKRGDLFSELSIKRDLFYFKEKKPIYTHSCNAQNVWGSGVAKAFLKYFPNAYQQYHNTNNKVGMGYIVKDGEHQIGCLITSNRYGVLKDIPPVILRNTEKSLSNLLNSYEEKDMLIYSPKINSGLFAVPWEDTENIIKKVCEASDKNIEWVVWEL